MADTPWWKRDKPEEKKVEDDLPESIKQQLSKVDTIESKLGESTSKIDSIVAGLESVNAYIKTQQTREEEATRARARQTQLDNEPSPEDLAAALLQDPQSAVNRMTSNQATAIMELRADNIRRETFEDGEKFPYYSGEIKNEINNTIANQTLAFRQNPANLENVYYTVIGKRSKEINEGKLKTRFATPSGSSLSSGGSDSDKGKIKIEVTDDIRKAARLVGIKAEDYADLLSKEAEEGNINYV